MDSIKYVSVISNKFRYFYTVQVFTMCILWKGKKKSSFKNVAFMPFNIMNRKPRSPHISISSEMTVAYPAL